MPRGVPRRIVGKDLAKSFDTPVLRRTACRSQATDRRWLDACHCPAERAGRALVNALRAEAELLGATIDGETEIVSHTPGNDGDQQMTLECLFGDVDIRIRVTVLRETAGSSVVVTIDQRKR